MEGLKPELDLALNHTYLLKFGVGEMLYSATVLMITDKAVYIRWNHALESRQEWIAKMDMYLSYNIVEDITKFVEVKDGKTIVIDKQIL